MKDLLIAIAVLLILVAVFSHYDVRPEQDTAPHADGTREQGESEHIEQGKGDNVLQDIPEPPSPQTGDRFYRLW